MDIHGKLLLYAEILYQRALDRFEAGKYRRAEYLASAASGAAVFVEQDTEAPREITERARALSAALTEFLSTVWRASREEYGDRFLSGPKKGEKEVEVFLSDVRDAAREAHGT